jgi:hypothetical protein
MMPWEWKTFMRRNPAWWTRPEFQCGVNLKVRSECLGPAPLTVGRGHNGVNLAAADSAPDIPQAAGAGCDP